LPSSFGKGVADFIPRMEDKGSPPERRRIVSKLYSKIVEEFLITAVGYLRLAVEAVGAAVIGIGALSTTFLYALSMLGLKRYTNTQIRLHLGQYLALGIEFQLGSDILGTAVSPTPEELGMLAAIVVIRTVLNYFLSKELEREREELESDPQRAVLPPQ
jgi:uncharacterized membrane protein